jgi:hypothetical protein
MGDPAPQLTQSLPTPRFQFNLRTLLLLFVLLASSLGAFGAWGIANFAMVVVLAIFLRRADSIVPSAYVAAGFLCLTCLFGPLTGLKDISDAIPDVGNGDRLHAVKAAMLCCSTLPNLAALVLWLVSAGAALAWAVKNRSSTNAPRKTKTEFSPSVGVISKFAYQDMLLTHGVFSLVLLALLVIWFAAVEPMFRFPYEYFDRIGELHGSMWFAARVSPYLLRLLPLALAVDAIVLYTLGRLPRNQRWCVAVWFILAVVGLVVINALLLIGLLCSISHGSTTVG